MKKITILFICIFLLALSGYRAEAAQSGGPVEFTDEMIEQMTKSYLNMDIDEMVKMSREAGRPMDEKTIEAMRDLQKMAREGTLGDHLRSFNAEEEEDTGPPIGDWLYAFTGGVPYLSPMNLGVAEIEDPPDTKRALEIAKKYYDMCLPKIESGLKPGFDSLINWTPDFITGNKTDPDKAVSLSAAAALTQRMTDAAYCYTALNAAVFGLDPDGAAGAINLATAIATAGEDLEAKKTPGTDIKEFYSDALSMYCHALNVAGQDEGEHVITALTSVGALFWDMGNLTAAEKVLSVVVEMDPNCCEAFDLLYNLYVSTGRYKKARELRLKSPTRPIYMAVQKALEADKKTLKDVESYLRCQNEADINALAEQMDKLKLATLADYYEPFDPSAAADVRRHAESMKDMMKGLAPPDMAKHPMFSSYDAYRANVLSGEQGPDELMWEWSEKVSQLNEKKEYLHSVFVKKLHNLGTLLSMKNDHLNPNDMELQFDMAGGSTNLLISGFSCISNPMYMRKMETFPEMDELAEKKRKEIEARHAEELEQFHDYHRGHDINNQCGLRQSGDNACKRAHRRLLARQHNELNDHYSAVFANAMNLTLPLYDAFRKATIKAHPVVMSRIMMISDDDVQQYYLTLWEYTLTTVTSEALDMLGHAVRIVDWNFSPRKEEEAEMADPNPTRRSELAELEGPSNEDIIRRRQAREDFYSGKINEDSALYKKMDDMYGAEVNLFFFKFRINEFITRTSAKVDLGFASGEMSTFTNRVRDTTSYDGTLKIGVSKKINDKASIKAGASGSLSVTIDGNGDVVPNSVQWKVGLEATVKGGPLSLKTGTGYGSEGGYATMGAELSKFGGTMGVGIEATASKGTRLSGDASISNEAIKDTAKSLAGDSAGGKKASDGFGGFHDNFAKKKKTLWKGEYVIQD
ncbi:MAG: hypothetical protein FWG09_04440 [Synergistaceae bacterium]|nr:hypothetical protein [Synergistaceae bacterium]